MLGDSGMETDLIFHEGFDLPLFASFTMLDDPAKTDALRNYYRRHIPGHTESLNLIPLGGSDLAGQHRVGKATGPRPEPQSPM